MGKLTAVAVKAATKPGRYQDGKGLMLFVKESGARYWVLRIQVDGKRRDVGLGPAADVSLAAARDRADDLRRQYRNGADPLAEKRAAKLASAALPTFREAAINAHGEHKAGWRNEKHRADWLSSLERFAFAELGDMRVDLIDAPKVRDILLPIWLERPETARRVRQRIKLVIDWSVAKGYRPALDLSGIARALPRQPKTDSHFVAMPYVDVPAFVASLSVANETMSRLALRFLIHTTARSGEVRGATWREVDLVARTWTVPGSRMKAGKAHVVPLSDSAIAILKRAAVVRTSDDAPLFPGTKGQPLSDMTMLKIMRDRSLPFSVHGFRSAFKTWAVEATSFPDAVSEAALAHIDANKVRSAYSRTDFRQQRESLMAAWANFLADESGIVRAIRQKEAAA
ncbi:MAG: integrase arm-type DNA-binding domain-containing protein [Sphingomonas sp.]